MKEQRYIKMEKKKLSDITVDKLKNIIHNVISEDLEAMEKPLK